LTQSDSQFVSKGPLQGSWLFCLSNWQKFRNCGMH